MLGLTEEEENLPPTGLGASQPSPQEPGARTWDIGLAQGAGSPVRTRERWLARTPGADRPHGQDGSGAQAGDSPHHVR